MSNKTPEPMFNTPEDQINKVEQFKLESKGAVGHLHDDFLDLSQENVVEATEQVAKSHGVYLEYNRAKTGREKDWMYMVRITIPGGGSFTSEQWEMINVCAEKHTAPPHGMPSIRLTTRQNIQFHWVKKKHLPALVQDIAKTGYFTLNGCGDNARNVMACPLSKFSTIFNGNELAAEIALYFRLPAEAHIKVFEIDTSLIRTPESHFEYSPKLLNRKFKIGISAVHQSLETGQWEGDNCVELRTNDLGIAPIVEKGRVDRFMVYLGGGQGEKNGKATFATLAKPFGIFHRDQLMAGLDTIVKIHQDYGDRKNRHWARLKYVIQKMGIAWYQQQVRERGIVFEQPFVDFDPGARDLHHGWSKQPSNDLWTYGMYIENGRLIDTDDQQLRQLTRELLQQLQGVELLITPNQDLLFTNIAEEAKEKFQAILTQFNYGQRQGKAYSVLRMQSGACVGLETCRLSYTESEKYEPMLLDQLEARGYGDIKESIGITGCERQCFRPATKTICLIGQGPDLYCFKLGGSVDARYQGQYLTLDGQWYLRRTPRDNVPDVISALFDYWKQNQDANECLGAFIRRVGNAAVIDMLKQNESTADLMVKTYDAPYQPETPACQPQ